MIAAFSPYTALLGAPKWRSQIAMEPGIDPHYARFYAFRHAVSPAQIFGPNGS